MRYNGNENHNPDSPCRNCTDRSAGCHSTCSKYMAFDILHEDYRERTKKIWSDYMFKNERINRWYKNNHGGHGKSFASKLHKTHNK